MLIFSAVRREARQSASSSDEKDTVFNEVAARNEHGHRRPNGQGRSTTTNLLMMSGYQGPRGIISSTTPGIPTPEAAGEWTLNRGTPESSRAKQPRARLAPRGKRGQGGGCRELGRHVPAPCQHNEANVGASVESTRAVETSLLRGRPRAGQPAPQEPARTRTAGAGVLSA